MKKIFAAVALAFATTGALAAASPQGCESSGGQAAGCTPVTNTTTTTVSPSIRTDVINTNLNANRSTNINGVESSNTNLNVNGGNRNANSNRQGQDQSQSQSATGIGLGGAGGVGVGGNQTQSANSQAGAQAQATNNGVSQGVVVNNVSNTPDSIKTVGEAPSMITTTTAACRVAIQASAGWLGGAFGFGTSVLDEGCDAREDARLLVNMGERAAAVLRLCAKPEMAAALGPKCPPAPKSEPTPEAYK